MKLKPLLTAGIVAIALAITACGNNTEAAPSSSASVTAPFAAPATTTAPPTASSHVASATVTASPVTVTDSVAAAPTTVTATPPPPKSCLKAFVGSNAHPIAGGYVQLVHNGTPIVNMAMPDTATKLVIFWDPAGGIILRTNYEPISGGRKGAYSPFTYLQGLDPTATTNPPVEFKEFDPWTAGDTSYALGFQALEGSKPGGGIPEQQAALDLASRFAGYWPELQSSPSC